MVPGSLCRYRRSAPDLHGTSRTGREECQFSEHAEGRERSGRHAFGASRGTRKRRFRENREPQDGRCSGRQQTGRSKKWLRWNGACVRSRVYSGRSLLRRNTIVTREKFSREQKTENPCNQSHQPSVFCSSLHTPSCWGLSLGRSELNVVEAGHDGRLTVKKWRPSASCSPSSTSTLAHIGNRDFSGRSDVWPELCSCSCTSGATALRPNETARRQQNDTTAQRNDYQDAGQQSGTAFCRRPTEDLHPGGRMEVSSRSSNQHGRRCRV